MSLADPLVSFVAPVSNAKVSRLEALLDSVRRQPPGLCELIFSEEGSLSREVRDWLAGREKERGVTIVVGGIGLGFAAAVNAGVARTRAPWVSILRPDDALDAFAAERIARSLEEHPNGLLLYTDELVADERLRPREAILKPGWDPVLLSGFDYLGRSAVYRRSRFLEIGGFREGFEGSEAYDLALRYTDGLDASRILHLPYPAHIRRGDRASPSASTPESARRALAERFSRPGRKIEVGRAVEGDGHRVRFDGSRSDWPSVSVVVPSRDSPDLITRVLRGLLERTDYPELEVIVVDNGSTDREVLALYRDLARSDARFRVQIEPEPFNFSRAVNRGIALASGGMILLLNNDIEILEGGWLKEMVSCFDYEDVGIVGAKLLYPDRSLQHAGVIAGLGGYAGHWFIGESHDFPGPMGRLRVRQSLSVVTGACMLVSVACLRAVGSFDETTFPIAYNDVDFCLRAVDLGFRVVWTPFACLVHHESASRGSDETERNIERFNRDKANLRERHRTDALEDRAFNPWCSKHQSHPHPVPLESLPRAR